MKGVHRLAIDKRLDFVPSSRGWTGAMLLASMQQGKCESHEQENRTQPRVHPPSVFIKGRRMEGEKNANKEEVVSTLWRRCVKLKEHSWETVTLQTERASWPCNTPYIKILLHTSVVFLKSPWFTIRDANCYRAQICTREGPGAWIPNSPPQAPHCAEGLHHLWLAAPSVPHLLSELLFGLGREARGVARQAKTQPRQGHQPCRVQDEQTLSPEL